jgi:hypothetical protein
MDRAGDGQRDPIRERAVKDACGSFGIKIRIIHEPSDDNPNPAYTAIRRYRSDDLQLLELLATDAWSRIVEAKDYLNR